MDCIDVMTMVSCFAQCEVDLICERPGKKKSRLLMKLGENEGEKNSFIKKKEYK